MRRLAALLVSLVASVGVLVPASGAGAAVDPGAAEARFLQLLNTARAGANLNLLTLDPAATTIARGWSGSMAAAGVLSHNPNLASAISAQVTPNWTHIGENVGEGYDVDALNAALWASAPHRANILGAYDRVGVGVVVGGDGAIWVTFDFVQGPPIAGPAGVGDCNSPGYVLDGWGGVHPVGGAPALSTTAYWPGWDIARDLSLSAGHGGQVLDGWGGLHSVGGAAPLISTGYWPGWDIARGVAVSPDGTSAYVLDGWGGVHPAGRAAPVAITGFWPGWDIARDIQLDPTSPNRGYVLEGFGGLHAFGGMAPAIVTGWRPADVARSFTFLADGSGGYVVDALGDTHPFAVAGHPLPPALGNAPLSQPTVRGVLMQGTNNATVVTFEGARIGVEGNCATPPMWNWDIARAAVSA